MNTRLLSIIIPLASLLAGCAMMFCPNRDRIEIVGPEDIGVHDSHDRPLKLLHDGDKLYVRAMQGDDDSLIVEYRGYRRVFEVNKSFNGLTLLNIESVGIGFIVDDAGHALYTYDPIYVLLDAGCHHPDTQFVERVGNLGKWHYADRPRLIISGGWGFGGWGATQVVIGPPHVEWGTGIEYHSFGLLYRSSSDFYADLTPNRQTLQYDGHLSSRGAEIRCYPLGGLFVEGGYSQVTAEGIGTSSSHGDSAYDYGTGVSYPASSSSFPAMTMGIGWAGDISYAELHYIYGLRDYQLFDVSPIRLKQYVFSLGLFLKF